ncbi:hypothetical protein OC835_002818 [Tilletia horrida]|uniref:Peptidase M20 dimerisation domain-containing protein n=1 Tax=Tilletia horrida TaxID=155126 RepID=A0AAN6GEA2_9BASI|nr:hypothetical protein OC842_003027 [Tilletia horrida]KAK0534028.1 hypothetical protein OC835_002818 [Tilletia horrida]KAK0563442.1 hypothetical protein OC844_002217 [Tilletia horrida]
MPGCFSFLSRPKRGSASSSSSPARNVDHAASTAFPLGHEPAFLPAYSPPGTHAPVSAGLLLDNVALSGVMKELSQTIESTAFGLSGELRKLSLKMFEYKELAFEEFKTHDLFCDWFEDKYGGKKGWTLTRHAHGLETAFRVEFEHRPKDLAADAVLPCLGFNSELDALPGIGHACGHPLIAICGIAAAIGTAEALVKHNLPGKVVLLGTPAEEAGGGKCILIERGAYKGMDVCAMAHPGPYSTVGTSLAVSSFQVTYTGQASHAAASPWTGRNALDAAVQAYVNLSTLRQQVPPSHRMHAIIKGDNLVVNVIPDEALLICNARAPTKAELEALVPRVKNCFEAGALATECKMKIETTLTYLDLENSSPLSGTFRHVMASKYDDVFDDIPMIGSTDFGNVTYEVPSFHPLYSIPLKDPVGGGNHTRSFEHDARSEAAHKKSLQVAVATALSCIKIVVDENYAKEVRSTWEEWKKGSRPHP